MNQENNNSIQESSGNIFADIGLQEPDQEQLKAGLTLQVYRLIKSRKLTQKQACKIPGIKQPQVSALMRNRSGNLSVGQLRDFLATLEQGVEIKVGPAPSSLIREKCHRFVSVV